MSERKYTDEEIINKMSAYIEMSCRMCGFKTLCNELCAIEFIKEALKAALGLIKSQKADIEKLQEVNADLNESLRLAAEANKDLKAEIEEWEARAKERQGRVKKYLAEIERMEQESNFLAKRFYKEGVKDLAERLKGNMCHGYPYLEIEEDLFRRDVDNLVAEMTEGK